MTNDQLDRDEENLIDFDELLVEEVSIDGMCGVYLRMHPVAFDLDRAYRLSPAATLRPEPFGALAYHFGNRRLSFLKSRQLVTVVRLLDSHDSAAGALDAAGVPAEQRARYAAALAALVESEVIDAR